jgi:GT2 family glycosyltransferase
MKKVGVVVLNYKLKKEVDRALKSVFDSKEVELEVVLVDNDSDDGVSELTEKYPKLHFIQSGSNKGFSGGNNIGIKMILDLGCEYILLLNPDAWVDKYAIRNMVQCAEDSGPVIIGPKIYFPDGKTILYAGGILDTKNVLGSHRGVDEIDDGRFDDVSETDYVTGGVMFIDSKIFKKIGLLDERYFLYYEDADFCYRAKQAGFKVLYYPKAIAYHESGKATGIGSPLQDYYITRNRMLFSKKFLPNRTTIALLREGIRNWSNRSRRKAMVDFLIGKYGKQEIT